MCCDSAKMGSVQSESIKEAWNNSNWKAVRRSFLRDEQHPSCRICWQREELGLTSGRDPGSEQTFRQIASDCKPDGTMRSFPTNVSFRLGPQCNLKCIMCAPFNSTKWNEDADMHALYVGPSQDFIPPPTAFTEGQPLEIFDHVEHLTFIGGEPLLVKAHLKILDYLIHSGRSDQITLKYFTNTTLLPEWAQDYWSNFKRLEIRSSLDGTGDVFNYVRFPARWGEVEKVIEKINRLRLRDLDYGICFVFMNVNAFALEDLFRWRQTFPWKISPPTIRPDLIENPSFFRAELLSSLSRVRVLESLDRVHDELTQNEEEKSLIRDLKLVLRQRDFSSPERIETQRTRLLSYLGALDQRRNLSSRHTLPHLFEFPLLHEGLENIGPD